MSGNTIALTSLLFTGWPTGGVALDQSDVGDVAGGLSDTGGSEGHASEGAWVAASFRNGLSEF